jgi:hypothetical protein
MDFDTEAPKEQIEAEKRKKREGGGEGGELLQGVPHTLANLAII